MKFELEHEETKIVLGMNRAVKTFKKQDIGPKTIQHLEKWKESQNIASDAKVFTIDWNYPDVAEALKSRGWVQNPDSDSLYYDLKYSRNARIPKIIYDWQFLNHFPRNYELTAKWNLCETIKKNEHLTRISCLNYFPRCFQMEKSGYLEFCNTYKLIYCSGFLQDFLKNPSPDNIKKAELCNSICKKWISDIKLRNGKATLGIVLDSEWAEILHEEKPLRIEEEEAINSTKLEEFPKTLAKLAKNSPQYEMTGTKNIWIIKPGRKSRGRDIKILTRLEDIKEYVSEPNYWIAQKYIENPLLINSRKFDIRQWVLITCFDPLTIWIYNRCYLRFTAAEFSFEDLSNNFMHLTNNSISKNASNFENTENCGFMWDLEQFKEHLLNLKGYDVWSESLFPAIKRLIISSILTAGKLIRRNSFELLGLDLMVDTSLRPWLIEINSSPAMDYSTVLFI